MINKFKQFENIQRKGYVIVFKEEGIFDNLIIFDDKQTVNNWIINFVHDNVSNVYDENYNEIKDVFDIKPLLDYYNDFFSPDNSIIYSLY